MKRLLEMPALDRSRLTTSAGRGPGRQMPQRQREQILREHVVSFKDWMENLGLSRAQAAALLNLSPRTLRHWEYQRRQAHRFVHPLGRPAQCSTPEQRNQVIAVLDELGPAVGVPLLRQAFPGMVRAELEDILLRYRRIWRLRHYQPLRILHWHVPGAVWAADFTGPLPLIDGKYPYLLAVRDLASAQQLLWLPVRHPDSQEVVQALASLFASFGAPLVLKTDNGSPFSADATRALLHQFMTLLLFSPPYWPRYNGAIEAGIGSLKTRTEVHACRQGHPGYWTGDDVAAARAEANASARPHGPNGPTPDEAWHAQRPITAEQRMLFHAAVDRCRCDFRTQPDYHDWPDVGPLTDYQARALDRQAIRRALEVHGILSYTRRRIPLPINKQKVTCIT
ncbi:MAG TPA: DDE-type integrase/transposase/recombinase [Gemmataceae bacterium]|nr:DDE-type integrase/transposase/recombinase [Gemmataceae bacterium]